MWNHLKIIEIHNNKCKINLSFGVYVKYFKNNLHWWIYFSFTSTVKISCICWDADGCIPRTITLCKHMRFAGKTMVTTIPDFILYFLLKRGLVRKDNWRNKILSYQFHTFRFLFHYYKKLIQSRLVNQNVVSIRDLGINKRGFDLCSLFIAEI